MEDILQTWKNSKNSLISRSFSSGRTPCYPHLHSCRPALYPIIPVPYCGSSSTYASVNLTVAGDDKVGILNTGNRDVGSDKVNKAVDMGEIISRMKPDLLSRLKSVAAGAA